MSISSPPPFPLDQDPRRTLEEKRRDARAYPVHPHDLDLFTALESLAPLPAHSLFLGVCEDGLPLLMDLTNPSPGSLLVVGDDLAANRNLLRTALASLAWSWTPGDVQIEVITTEARPYTAFRARPGFLRLTSPYTPQAVDLVWHFASSASRRAARPGRGTQLLVIDDLEALLTQLDADGMNALAWLVRNGPQVLTWVLASFDARRFRQVDDQVLSAFPTRLSGYLPSLRFSEILSGLPSEVTAALASGAQFCARIAGELVQFWLPHLDLAWLENSDR